MERPTTTRGQMTAQEICSERQEQGLPANRLTVRGSDRIVLDTPKGSTTLRWDGEQLLTIVDAKPLRLHRLVIDQLLEALAVARPARYEDKHGWEIEDGDREGWEYVGDAGDAGAEASANRYQRLEAVERYDEVWFSAADLIR